MTAYAHRYRIIGTPIVIYAAYEPTGIMGPHSTTMTHPETGERLGSVHTFFPRGEGVDLLPAMSEERRIAYRNHHAAQCERSLAIIRAAFPESELEAMPYSVKDGEIEALDHRRTLNDEWRAVTV